MKPFQHILIIISFFKLYLKLSSRLLCSILLQQLINPESLRQSQTFSRSRTKWKLCILTVLYSKLSKDFCVKIGAFILYF